MNNFAEMVTGMNTPRGSKIFDTSCSTALFVGCAVSRDGNDLEVSPSAEYLVMCPTISPKHSPLFYCLQLYHDHEVRTV